MSAHPNPDQDNPRLPLIENSKGRFLTFEGIEGAGKSTQANMCVDWLRSLGETIVFTREPGGSPKAEILRQLLLDGSVKPFGADAEALVFALARANHMRETIRPALQSGAWVICDRFMDSTRAYQGAAGVAPERLDELELLAVGDDRPDHTLVFDVEAGEGLERIERRAGVRDRFEADHLAVHEARRAAFLAIARDNPERCVVIDSSGSPDETFKIVRAIVAERFGLTDNPGTTPGSTDLGS